MSNCGTCKHLGKAVEEWDEDYEPLPVKFHVCDWMEHNYQHTGRWPKAAYVMDGSGYLAALCVADDFGCKQWTAK